MKRPKAGQLVNYGLEFQLLIPVKKTELSAMERPRKTVRNSTFYSPQLFEANLKTAFFFLLKTFCESQRFLVLLSLEGFYVFPIVAWACLDVILYFCLYTVNFFKISVMLRT